MFKLHPNQRRPKADIVIRIVPRNETNTHIAVEYAIQDMIYFANEATSVAELEKHLRNRLDYVSSYSRQPTVEYSISFNASNLDQSLPFANNMMGVYSVELHKSRKSDDYGFHIHVYFLRRYDYARLEQNYRHFLAVMKKPKDVGVETKPICIHF